MGVSAYCTNDFMAPPTSCRVQPPSTAVALEMFGFLVGNQDLEVVKVALAIVAPWPLELLVQIGISLALLRHVGGRTGTCDGGCAGSA